MKITFSQSHGSCRCSQEPLGTCCPNIGGYHSVAVQIPFILSHLDPFLNHPYPFWSAWGFLEIIQLLIHPIRIELSGAMFLPLETVQTHCNPFGYYLKLSNTFANLLERLSYGYGQYIWTHLHIFVSLGFLRSIARVWPEISWAMIIIAI